MKIPTDLQAHAQSFSFSNLMEVLIQSSLNQWSRFDDLGVLVLLLLENKGSLGTEIEIKININGECLYQSIFYSQFVYKSYLIILSILIAANYFNII